MSPQDPSQPSFRQSYWDGTRWRHPEGSTPRPHWDGTRWHYPGQASPPSPPPPALEAVTRHPARRRSSLGAAALVLAALVVLGSVGSILAIGMRNHDTGQATRRSPSAAGSAVPISAPGAPAIFNLPYAKDVRSARFHEVIRSAGSTEIGEGVIEFAPEHAFYDSLSSPGGAVFERDLEVGGVAYIAESGSPYRAGDFESNAFQFLGWDGNPLPSDLWVAAQTSLDGQRAWVVEEGAATRKWIVGEQTGDPLQAVLGGTDTFTFSDWGQAPAIQAPAAGDVSTALYSGSGSAPVRAPAATLTVLGEQADSADSDLDPAGFRTVALELSYQNTSGAASHFDNGPTLVSSDGVFSPATYTELSPALQGENVAPGQTVTGWDAFLVPQPATSFHLLFGEQLDQMPNLDYLISVSLQVPG